MNSLFNKIGSIILSLATVFFGLNGGVANKNDVTQEKISQYVQESLSDGKIFGSVLNVAGSTYNLAGTGVSSSATSITLSSLTLTQTGQKLVDSDFSDTFYITLEPGNRSKQEIVSCTTVVQNASSATLSGCTRGLSPIYPYTASTTLQFVHGGGSQVIFSDPPQLFASYGAKANDETITGSWSFPEPTIASNVATKNYADTLAFNGSPNGSETVKGIWEGATAIEQASSTSAGSTAALLSLRALYATSTASIGCNGTSVIGALCAIIARNNGSIDPQRIATSSSDNYVWGGTSRFNGISLFTASTTLTATTSIAATNVLSNALIINNLAYAFPSSRGSANTILKENGSGTLTWGTPSNNVYTYASTSAATVGANIIYTSSTLAIPASTLTASSTVSIKGSYVCVTGGSSVNNCTLDIVDNSGNVYVTYSINTTISKTDSMTFEAVILANNSTAAQRSTLTVTDFQNTTFNALTTVGNTSSVDWTVARTFGVKLTTSSGSSNTGTLNAFSIIVTP
jgi:hypothetical protein